MFKIIGGIAALGLAAFAGYWASNQYGGVTASPAPVAASAKVAWVAAAPGRVEPKGGEVGVGTAIIGRVTEVSIKVNDDVEEGQLLIKLDDAEARARLAAAETQADVREKARDDQQLNSNRRDVRDAEDEVYRAERAVTGARIELDYALNGKRDGSVNDQTLENARRRLREAEDRVQRARVKVAQAQAEFETPCTQPSGSCRQ